MTADAATFDCKRGTIFGREVVPDVCKLRATSSDSGTVSAALPVAEVDRVKLPAGLFSVSNDYYWNGQYDGSQNVENDVVWFRITVSDGKNTGYQIPNANSMFMLKTYFAIKFK